MSAANNEKVAQLQEFGKKKGLRWKRLEKTYKIGELLGEGNFAQVFKGTHKKTKKEYALKIVQKKSADAKKLIDLQRLAQEVQILATLKHPGIMGFYEVIETKTKVVLVCELLQGGELFDRVVAKGSYTEAEAATVVKQLLEAVDYSHKMKIVHRDLKPENIILAAKGSDTQVKISDFGLAKLLDESYVTSTLCGTPMYVAPEILKGKTNPYGPKVDIWAVGVIAYILLAGYPPFFDNDLAKLYRQIIDVDFEFDDEYWGDISDEATDFIDTLLVADPEDRPTASEALKHPWFDHALHKSSGGGKNLGKTIARLATFVQEEKDRNQKNQSTKSSQASYQFSDDDD
mmetsp:Transcript_13575/g.20464  ORF Transcript_13575/g.20464 Transcript_13575/m.20464 type:complete len:345 (+) Transcript_13575:68-1102(+)|eukprot:CAMPEP_0201544944 /NCGR_PEP_ID=MMETSP0173_2-20130828/1560_1 /ASSEMBLY_ACC=CAM_ASM_000268 /TAXON_ID=218659 /ORGANISM="Vexillifera sp., Strain DIVA3 564/2" /LENGTH=344 /DNA_ID=CAMNT_0047953237 /DNA_START=51 /DNA_END=1085 /DNA_ORIENTATION=-